MPSAWRRATCARAPASSRPGRGEREVAQPQRRERLLGLELRHLLEHLDVERPDRVAAGRRPSRAGRRRRHRARRARRARRRRGPLSRRSHEEPGQILWGVRVAWSHVAQGCPDLHRTTSSYLVWQLSMIRYGIAPARVPRRGGRRRAASRSAAERLHVAQPGVSAQVRRLEAELGEGAARPLRAAPCGRPTVGAAVLPHARAALEAVAAVRRTVEERAGLLGGRVAVGIVGAGTAPRLPDLLAGFRRAHPAVRLTLAEAPADRLVAAVLAGELDLAVIAAVDPLAPGLATHVVSDEALVAAVAHDHPLARRATIGLADLAGHELIALPPGAGLRTGLDTAMARAGVRPRIALEANDPPMLAELAARGLGVAIVPESITHAPARIAARPCAAARVARPDRAGVAGAGPVEPGRARHDRRGPRDTSVMADRNVLGGELEPCGTDPVTGFYRDGCCSTGPEDRGSHTICAVVTAEFLEHQRGIGNDLGTPDAASTASRASSRATAGA